MASKIPEEDFELAYIRRQRATKAAIFDAQQAKLAAEEEFDRREYEHLLKRKQAASSAAAPPPSSQLPPPSESLAQSPIRPVGAPAPRYVIDLSTPEPENRSWPVFDLPTTFKQEEQDETSTTEVDQGDNQIEGQSPRTQNRAEHTKVTESRARAFPSPRKAPKRRRTDNNSHEESSTDDGIYRGRRKRTTREPNSVAVAVNDSFPTVLKMPDGNLAEYRCGRHDCHANGAWRYGTWHFFAGIRGLQNHIRRAWSHPSLSEMEITTSCVFRKLGEEESAAVLRGDTEGCKIERAWADTVGNIRQSKASSRKQTQDPSSLRMSLDGNPSVPMDTADKETARFQLIRRGYFAKKMEDLATLEEDEAFQLLEKEEKARLKFIGDNTTQQDSAPPEHTSEEEYVPKHEVDEINQSEQWD